MYRQAILGIISTNNKFLLLHKADAPKKEFYFLSGGIDGKETPEQTLYRELFEEVGIEVKREDLEMIHVMHRVNQGEERIDFFFCCKTWQGEIVNSEPEKCNELKWVKLKQLPKKIVPYVKFALEQFEQKIRYSEFSE